MQRENRMWIHFHGLLFCWCVYRVPDVSDFSTKHVQFLEIEKKLRTDGIMWVVCWRA